MKDGSSVEANFVDGEIQGQGIKMWADGRRYEGEFLNGELHGEGTLYNTRTKEKCQGTWKNNKMEGTLENYTTTPLPVKVMVLEFFPMEIHILGTS